MTSMTRRRFVGTLALAGTLAPPARGVTAPRIGSPAPEIAGGPWINSAPLTTADLRGRVALVEFWTYG
jgi:hypothetical protein